MTYRCKMRSFILFTLVIVSLSLFHLTHGGIFRRYVRKHRPGGHRIPSVFMSIQTRMGGNGPLMVERQFTFRQHQRPPWSMFLSRRPRAPAWPPIMYNYPLQFPFMIQTQPRSLRASRRFRFLERQDSSRVPQFHHQPITGRHHHPIGISTTSRLPTTSAVQWRPLDYGNPIDRDPTYDYAPPAIERVRFVSEVRGRQPTARANTGMLGMYSRPSPVIVPAPFKRDPNVRARHPLQALPSSHHQQQIHLQLQQQQQQHPHSINHQHLPPFPPPPRGTLPLWKLLAHKQRPRRPQRPVAAAARPPLPPRFIGQDLNHPLYHHQVYQPEEAEVFPRLTNIVYFKPTDVVPGKNSGKTSTSAKTKTAGLKPGSVASADLYSAEVSSASEFKPVKQPATTSFTFSPPVKKNHAQSSGNKYKFTVVGYSGPAATTPMSPVASAPSTAATNRPPTVLYAVKTTPETLSTTHNSAVKPLEPTESLEPEDQAEASELQPVQVLPEHNHEIQEDGREHGGQDVDFDTVDDNGDDSSSAPVPVVPNSFNVFESLLSSLEFGENGNGDEDPEEEEDILDVKDNHHHQRPMFEPTKEPSTSTARNFETSTSVSMSVGVSSKSSSSSKKHHKHEEDEEEVDDTDGYFAIRTQPTTTTTSTTTTTTERPVMTSTATTTTTTTTTEIPTTTSTTTPKSTSTAYPRLPTMPTYKRKPTPVYARKSSKAGGLLHKYSSSSSSVSKEVTSSGGGVPNGSGEVVIITAGRSKVKEYKPQVIANQTHLLAFDKVVAPVDGEVKESPLLINSDSNSNSNSNASPSTSTTKSPLEDFDAMQLLHSWLNKA